MPATIRAGLSPGSVDRDEARSLDGRPCTSTSILVDQVNGQLGRAYRDRPRCPRRQKAHLDTRPLEQFDAMAIAYVESGNLDAMCINSDSPISEDTVDIEQQESNGFDLAANLRGKCRHVGSDDACF